MFVSEGYQICLMVKKAENQADNQAENQAW
jgi:hypothetical protein